MTKIELARQKVKIKKMGAGTRIKSIGEAMVHKDFVY